MNISITGNLGSGKSSICRILKEKGYEIISAGTIFRQLAMENNMSVEEFNQKVSEDIRKGDHSVDDMIDRRTTEINSRCDNVIFDSRLAWNFAKGSFKVFVIVDIGEAANRVYNDSLRSDSESYDSPEACRNGLIHRQVMEKQRFKELYGVDFYDMSNYNLVIESTSASPQAIADEIIARFEGFRRGEFKQLIELNPSSVYPACPAAGLAYGENSPACPAAGLEYGENSPACPAAGLAYGENSPACPAAGLAYGEESPASPEATPGDPARVALSGGLWFTGADVPKLFQALKSRAPFLPVCVDNSLLPCECDEAACRRLEQLADFRYRSIPGAKSRTAESLMTFPQ